MVDKLEACTWCGHEGVLHSSSDGEVEWVRCVHCGRESPLAYSSDEAIRRWNAGEVRDAKPPAQEAEDVEEALQYLEGFPSDPREVEGRITVLGSSRLDAAIRTLRTALDNKHTALSLSEESAANPQETGLSALDNKEPGA